MAALAGKLAHPVNRPIADATGRVVAGHAILQPRVTPSLTAGDEASVFQRIFSANRGLDPYVFTVSDLYQDLFGQGSFTGKGLYDVDAFARATEGHDDPWEKAQAGLRAFLEAVQEPAYRQVVISDEPSVLGHERFREQEERSTYAIVDEIVRSALGTDAYDLDDAMLDTFTRIFFGAMSAAGGAVAVSQDPASAVARVELAIGTLMAGLRQLLDSGATSRR